MRTGCARPRFSKGTAGGTGIRRASPETARARSRLARAALLIGAVLVAILAADAAADAPAARAMGGNAGEELDQKGLLLAELEGSGDDGGTPALPDGFAEELFDLSGRPGLRVSSAQDVVGMQAEGTPDQALSEYAGLMGEKGWTEVPSGYGGCSSFVKNGGAYQWAFISCVPSAGKTAVVVQVA